MLTEILLPVLSIALISGVLAIIISLAEKRLNDYGVCKIDINDGARELEVEGGSSLLATLAAEKIFIPSACGGKATCGLCKLRVLDGAGPLLPTEEPYLSDKEREENYRLSCQLKVKTDMKLVIPEELFNIKEYITTVESLEDLTHDIKEVRLKLPPGEEIDFKAGQFMQFYSKPYGKVTEEVFRAYSISSAPSEKDHVEFCIRRVPDGICTTYVHDFLNEGDEVRLSGPYGEFYLRGDCDELLMIAGGSGLAPIRSLLLYIFENELEYKRIRFFFGAKTQDDLYYLDELAELEKEHPEFEFIAGLSRADDDETWDGYKGRVTEVMEELITEEDAAISEAYLCGSPGMLSACVRVLNGKGLGNDKIFFDEF